MRYESERVTQKILLENAERDLMATRFGLSKISSDKDMIQKAEKLNNKMEGKWDDYEMRAVPRDNNDEDEAF